MDRKNHEPIKIMSSESFVHGYKGQNQMNVNIINGIDVSSRTCKILRHIYGQFDVHAKESNDNFKNIKKLTK